MERQQGGWNAFVIFDCTIGESRKRCRQVPIQFRRIAMSNAATYWKIQGHQPPPKPTGFAGMSKPYQDWVCLEMTAPDLEWGKQQLAKVKASGKTAPDQDFGEMSVGFAGERVVDRWLTEEGYNHIWHHNPIDPKPDFEFAQVTADLKTHVTLGPPKKHYQTNVTDDQIIRSGSSQDWYLFGKLDSGCRQDYWVLGFLTPQTLVTKGKFYREGEITETKMDAKCDCWCIAYDELIKPLKWLGEHSEKKEP
jgi:hypothetical protein